MRFDLKFAVCKKVLKSLYLKTAIDYRFVSIYFICRLTAMQRNDLYDLMMIDGKANDDSNAQNNGMNTLELKSRYVKMFNV